MAVVYIVKFKAIATVLIIWTECVMKKKTKTKNAKQISLKIEKCGKMNIILLRKLSHYFENNFMK